MRTKVVNIPTIQLPLKPSPGFAKKGLSTFKLDICGLCEFGCRYCSSNAGNYLRINRSRFASLTKEQLGCESLPADDPALMFVWPNVLEQLKAQLDRVQPEYGKGQNMVFSMLTDGFSPSLVKKGITRAALQLVLDKTSFRIRVLTKNAVVSNDSWIEFFQQHRDRFVVGLSIGTTDDAWAKRVEIRTSLPSARLNGLARLQEAGIATYGMLCPVFPDVLDTGVLDHLLDRIRPECCEHVWAEPFNDRVNWEKVREGYEHGTRGYEWLTQTYENRNQSMWSSYATNLYRHLRDRAASDGWLHKLRYLLYEDGIIETDANAFERFEGVWLQSKPASDGRSKNPHIARMQRQP